MFFVGLVVAAGLRILSKQSPQKHTHKIAVEYSFIFSLDDFSFLFVVVVLSFYSQILDNIMMLKVIYNNGRKFGNRCNLRSVAFSYPQSALLCFSARGTGVVRTFSQEKFDNKKTEEGDNDNNKQEKVQVAAISFLSAVLGVFGVTIIMDFQRQEREKQMKRNNNTLEPQDVENSVPRGVHVPSNKYYVSRPLIEKRVIDFIESPKTPRRTEDSSFLILYGPRGNGLSTVVAKCIKDRKGVINVPVSHVAKYNRNESEEKRVSKRMKNTKRNISVSMDEFRKVLDKAKIVNEKTHDAIFPTIVLEVERGVATSDLLNMEYFAEKYAAEANVIIVLSESSEVVAFRDYVNRKAFVVVDEMSKEEAGELLTKRGRQLTEAELTYLYENIGGKPLALASFASCDPTVSVKDWVHDCLEHARFQLSQFPSQHKPLLSLLKKKNNGQDVNIFGKYVRQWHEFREDMMQNSMSSDVIFFDMNSNDVKLQSQALKVALKDYMP
jgi:hypothetical protein